MWLLAHIIIFRLVLHPNSGSTLSRSRSVSVAFSISATCASKHTFFGVHFARCLFRCDMWCVRVFVFQHDNGHDLWSLLIFDNAILRTIVNVTKKNYKKRLSAARMCAFHVSCECFVGQSQMAQYTIQHTVDDGAHHRKSNGKSSLHIGKLYVCRAGCKYFCGYFISFVCVSNVKNPYFRF